MTLAELLARTGLTGQRDEAEALMERLAAGPADWRRLAAVLALRGHRGSGRWPRNAGAAVLGVGGGQGAGKTTLSRLLVDALALLDVRAEMLSLDDFYLSRGEREALARSVHGLLSTRGVPGTHDAARLGDVLDALRAGEAATCPRFDKSTDDRSGETRIDAGVQVAVLEGWCVGAPAQPDADLAEPCNALERREDPGGGWRTYVNECLRRDYEPIWARLDELLFLRVPDMAAVRRWRGEQEAGLAPEARMSAAALERFVQHYERLTRWMGRCLPERADLVGLLDEDHGLADLIVR